VLGYVRNGQATLANFSGYVQHAIDDIGALMNGIQDEQRLVMDSDTIRHLHNLWEQIRGCPLIANPSGPYEVDEQLHHLAMLEQQCRNMVLEVGYATIPYRLNEWLDRARPGYYVHFHSVFEDELPDYDDRVKVLKHLAAAPESVDGGLIDVDDGLVYRYSPRWWSRLVSIAIIIIAFVGATALVIFSSLLQTGIPFGGFLGLPVWTVQVPTWPFGAQTLSIFLPGWIAVILGVIVHVGVGAAKRKQAQGGLPPVIALGDLPLHLDAKLGQILLKLFLALFGFYGLVFGAGIDNVTILNAFLIGYSLDSIVELFSSSIEQRAQAQTALLRQQLGVTSA
jgi:hypothetical protein